MLGKTLLVLSAATMLTAAPGMTPDSLPCIVNEQGFIQEEQSIPQTGEHISPLIAGMVLAFSGVAIGIIVDEKGKK